MIDSCEVLVHTCVDIRFEGHCRDWSRAQLGRFAHTHDHGVVQGILDNQGFRERLFYSWDLLIGKYGAKRLVLFPHGNGCAAYSARVKGMSIADELRFHTRQVEQAMIHIRSWRRKFPVEAYFAFRNGSPDHPVHFEPIRLS